MTPTSLPVVHCLINVYAAKDRAWFCDDYRPISSFVTTPPDSHAESVIGIGTVRLPVKISPDAEKSTLALRRPVNEIYLLDGTPAGFFKNERLTQLRLSGPRVGPRDTTSPGSPMQTRALINRQELGWRSLFQLWLLLCGIGQLSPFVLGNSYWINATWSAEEREKCVVQAPRSVSPTPHDLPQQTPDPLSDGEKRWLKDHYGGEFQFLRSFGLSIYKDEDREQGRQIMRVMMSKD
ncbi:hypothetical protein MY11210_000326 [Beauveria gryllotalpidicola]